MGLWTSALTHNNNMDRSLTISLRWDDKLPASWRYWPTRWHNENAAKTENTYGLRIMHLVILITTYNINTNNNIWKLHQQK
jgi:hypothetical protein